MLAAAKATGFTGKLASFDLSPEILQAIEAGTAEFAIDFQQYLMGYLPVLFLVQHASTSYRRPSRSPRPGRTSSPRRPPAKVLRLSSRGCADGVGVTRAGPCRPLTPARTTDSPARRYSARFDGPIWVPCWACWSPW